MKRILEVNRGLVMMTEFWPEGLRKMEVDPLDYLNLLSDFGFSLFEIDESEKTLRVVRKSSFGEWAGRERPTNLLCKRS